MQVKKSKVILSIIVLVSTIIFIAGCGGSGGGVASHSGLIDDRPKVPVSIKLFTSPDCGPIPSTAEGSVEITIYRGSLSDANRVIFNITRLNFSARSVEIGVFAGDTYSISLNARAKHDPLADREYIYRASAGPVFVPLENSGSVYGANLSMNLEQTEIITLYPARLSFEPLEKRTVKYGDTFNKISVTIYDQFGRIFEGARNEITLSADSFDNTTITPALNGTLTATPTAGSALFSNISFSSSAFKSGVTRFTAKIAASSSAASTAEAKSEDILIYNQSNQPAIAGLVFEKQPLPLAGIGHTMEEFTVAIIDQYGNFVDTDETITISAESGSLSGVLAVKAQNGTAVFNSITSGAPALINLKASIPGFSAFSDGIKIINGPVSKTRLFVSNQTYLYYYDFYYGEDSSKLAVKAVLAGVRNLGAIKKVKPSFDKKQLFILDDHNYFSVFTGLDSVSPGENIFNLGAFNTEKLIDFAPSIDNLSVYLISSKSVYKWHIVNEPNFVIANTPNIEFTNTASATEIRNNMLYLTGDRLIAPYDFSVYPPAARNQIPLYDYPSPVVLSADKKYAATAEIKGKNIYLINSDTEKFERIPLGQPELTGGACLKFSDYGNSQKLYLTKFSDGNIYSYNIISGGSTIIVSDSYASLKPLALDTDKTGRLLFALNGSGSAFVRIFDAKNDSFVEDIMLNAPDGQNISYYENVNSMFVY